MRSGWLALACVATVSAATPACIVVASRPSRYEVSYPPPAPPAEQPVLCNPGYTRVAGHWRWNGYQYVWVPQRCVYRPGYRYQPGGWVACGEGWCFREGVWLQGSVGP